MKLTLHLFSLILIMGNISAVLASEIYIAPIGNNSNFTDRIEKVRGYHHREGSSQVKPEKETIEAPVKMPGLGR